MNAAQFANGAACGQCVQARHSCRQLVPQSTCTHQQQACMQGCIQIRTPRLALCNCTKDTLHGMRGCIRSIIYRECLSLQITGTGNGAGKDPVSTAPYLAVINNVCPQCNYGDIDLQVCSAQFVLSHLHRMSCSALCNPTARHLWSLPFTLGCIVNYLSSRAAKDNVIQHL